LTLGAPPENASDVCGFARNLPGQVADLLARFSLFSSYDGKLKLWDMTTGKERATLGEYTGCLGCVAFSPDGKTLASGTIGSPKYFPDLKNIKLGDVALAPVASPLSADDAAEKDVEAMRGK
jgi:WD40 repeat protein